MMLTIHGLPMSLKYHDLKSLIKQQCNITEFILDNLVGDGNGTKKVRVGLPDDNVGAHVIKCLHGFLVSGFKLSVVPVGKSFQGVETSSYPQQNYAQATQEPWTASTTQWSAGPQVIQPQHNYEQSRPVLKQVYVQPQQKVPLLSHHGSTIPVVNRSIPVAVTIMKDNFQGPTHYNTVQQNPAPGHYQSQPQTSPIWSTHTQHQQRQPVEKAPYDNRNLRQCDIRPNPVEMPEEVKGMNKGQGRMSPNQRTVLYEYPQSNRRMSPPNRQVHLDNEISQGTRRMSPGRFSPRSRMSPSDRRMSPSGRRMSPSGRRISPPGRKMSPSGRRMSPFGRRMSPPGRRMSPSGRRMSPSGRRMSLPRHISPSGRRVSPGRRISPSGRMSPGRRMSPPRRDDRGRITLLQREPTGSQPLLRSPDGPRLMDVRRSPGRRPAERQSSPHRSMRYSPTQMHDEVNKYDNSESHNFKHVRPAYEHNKAPNQAMYSSGFRPNMEEKRYPSPGRESRWQDREKQYPPNVNRKGPQQMDAPRFLEQQRHEEDKKSRPLIRETPRDRSPIRDRYKRRSPSPRSPRRSWALEKRRSAEVVEAPPPPAWPGQEERRPKVSPFLVKKKEDVEPWERKIQELRQRHATQEEKKGYDTGDWKAVQSSSRSSPQRHPNERFHGQVDNKYDRKETDKFEGMYQRENKYNRDNPREYLSQEREEKFNKIYEERNEPYKRTDYSRHPSIEILQKKDELYKEIDDVCKRAEDFSRKAEMFRKGEHKREFKYNEERHEETFGRREVEDRYKSQGYDEDKRYKLSGKGNDEATKNEDFVNSKYKMSTEIKFKRDKAVHEISDKMMSKYGNSLRGELRNRVLGELKTTISRILFDMFGNEDISFIESIIKFNARHNSKEEARIYENVMSTVSSYYKDLKRPATDNSDIPTKTAKIPTQSKFSKVPSQYTWVNPNLKVAKNIPEQRIPQRHAEKAIKHIQEKQSAVRIKGIKREVPKEVMKKVKKITPIKNAKAAGLVPAPKFKKEENPRATAASKMTSSAPTTAVPAIQEKRLVGVNPAKKEVQPVMAQVNVPTGQTNRQPGKRQLISQETKTEEEMKVEKVETKVSKDMKLKKEETKEIKLEKEETQEIKPENEEKKIVQEMKVEKEETKLMKETTEHKELDELTTKLVNQELDNVMDKVWEALDDAETGAEMIAVDIIKREVADELRNAIGLNTAKRLLNIYNQLFVKIHFSCRPENGCLTKFLSGHSVKTFKRINTENNTFAVLLKNVADFDTLCNTRHLKCGSAELTVTPCYKFTESPDNLKVNFDYELKYEDLSYDDIYDVLDEVPIINKDNKTNNKEGVPVVSNLNNKAKADNKIKSQTTLESSINETQSKTNNTQSKAQTNHNEIKRAGDEEKPKDPKTVQANKDLTAAPVDLKTIKNNIASNKQSLKFDQTSDKVNTVKNSGNISKANIKLTKEKVPEKKELNVGAKRKKSSCFNDDFEVIDEVFRDDEPDEEMNDADILALLTGGVVLDECGSDD